MTKTFSKSKYIEVEGMEEYKELEVISKILGFDTNWIDECDGKSISYMRRRGYDYKDSWFISDGSEEDIFETKFNNAVELTIKELKELQDEAGLNIVEKMMFIKHCKNCFELLRFNLFEEEEGI